MHAGSFKAILIGVGRNSERGVAVGLMYNNVDLISVMNKDITTGKLQISG